MYTLLGGLGLTYPPLRMIACPWPLLGFTPSDPLTYLLTATTWYTIRVVTTSNYYPYTSMYVQVQALPPSRLLPCPTLVLRRRAAFALMQVAVATRCAQRSGLLAARVTTHWGRQLIARLPIRPLADLVFGTCASCASPSMRSCTASARSHRTSSSTW